MGGESLLRFLNRSADKNGPKGGMLASRFIPKNSEFPPAPEACGLPSICIQK